MNKPVIGLLALGMMLLLAACAWRGGDMPPERGGDKPPGWGSEGPESVALAPAADLTEQSGLALRLAVDGAEQLAVRVGAGEGTVVYEAGGDSPLANGVYLIPLDSGAAHSLTVTLWDAAGDELFRQERELAPADFQNGLLPDLAYLCVSGSREAAGYAAQLVTAADLWEGELMPDSSDRQLAALFAWGEAEYRAFRDLPLVGSPEQIGQTLALRRASSFIRGGSEIMDYEVLWVRERQNLEQGVYLYDMAWGVRPADPENERYLVGGQYVDEQGYIRDDRFNLRVLSLNEDGTYTDLGSPPFDMDLQQGLKGLVDDAYIGSEDWGGAVWNNSEYRFTLHQAEGDFNFTLGRLFGDFPWDNEELGDIARTVICGDDPGMDCCSAAILGEQGRTWVDWYKLTESGRVYISRLRTTAPYVYAGAVGCGMNEPRLLQEYPDVTEKPEIQPSGEESWCDFDKVYLFESGDYRPAQQIRYYVKDGFISGIEMKIILD